MPEFMTFAERITIESYDRIGDHILLGEVSVDRDKCKGCNLCVAACAAAALELVDNKSRMVEEMPACIACGDCVAICPEDAITIVRFLEFKKAFRYLDRGKPSLPRAF
jgi:2-oxoglutarate ferredoxin oxidoreductase subunit delta